MVKTYLVKLLRKEVIARDTWLFAFEKPEDYTFIPGQYQSITLTLANGRTDWRDFTITSNPQEKDLWVVTKITSSPSEFKKTLLNLPIGSSVTVAGGNGGFTINTKDKRPHVFIAGGIGVNVFRSILTAKQHENLKAVLLVSFSSNEYSLFEQELLEIGKKQSNKQVIYHFTTKEGRVSKKHIKKYFSGIQESIFMLAGKPNFVDAITLLLRRIRVPQKNIRIDYFSGYK